MKSKISVICWNLAAKLTIHCSDLCMDLVWIAWRHLMSLMVVFSFSTLSWRALVWACCLAKTFLMTGSKARRGVLLGASSVTAWAHHWMYRRRERAGRANTMMMAMQNKVIWIHLGVWTQRLYGKGGTSKSRYCSGILRLCCWLGDLPCCPDLWLSRGVLHEASVADTGRWCRRQVDQAKAYMRACVLVIVVFCRSVVNRMKFVSWIVFGVEDVGDGMRTNLV